MSPLAKHVPRLLPSLLVALALCLPAAAQDLAVAPVKNPGFVTGAATAQCTGGIVNDDGSFESALKVSDDGAAAEADVVMLFDGPGPGVRIDQVCVCWRRDPGAGTTLDHEVLIYAADGPGGTPGTLVDSIPFSVDLPIGQSFVTYGIESENILTPGPNFYVGVRWNSGPGGGDGYSLCADLSGSEIHPTFFKLADENDWQNINTATEVSVSAVGVRTELRRQGAEDFCAVSTCVEDEETLCLVDDRFRFRIAFDPPNDGDLLFESAHAMPLTDDSGYFWFFDEDNVEVVVKALDACTPFDRFWVFAAGLTNVETVINVCDTETGVARRYVNQQQTPFEPIQDTSAFATCP